MNLELIFNLQQKEAKGILPTILEKIKDKEGFVAEIQANAIKGDFTSLYIVSRNKDFFDQGFVNSNDFRLNAISEIIKIIKDEGRDASFQNQIINYIMQVRENNFLIYVLDNILYKEEYFTAKNIQVFISTLSGELKASKMDDEQKEKLQSVIYKHFINLQAETQESLLRMLEALKIVDLYKTAALFNTAGGTIRKNLADTVKNYIPYEKGSEIINDLNILNADSAVDENSMLIFIIALGKYEPGKIASIIKKLKINSIVYEYAVKRIIELMDERIIDESKFSNVLKMI